MPGSFFMFECKNERNLVNDHRLPGFDALLNNLNIPPVLQFARIKSVKAIVH
jgi:hypothetical protein